MYLRKVWIKIKYNSNHVTIWYCRCRARARTIGAYSRIATVIPYLGQSIFLLDLYSVKDWGQYLDDAPEEPETVDSSDSEASYF